VAVVRRGKSAGGPVGARARERDSNPALSAVRRSPLTPPADRKAMLRLVIEAIALAPIEVPRRATRVKVA
jgi:hypothetical protein